MKRIASALLLVASLSANAEFMSGNKLLDALNMEPGIQRGAAMGYIMGISDMGWGFTHCTPGSVTLGQILDLVRNHLTASPEIRHRTGDILVTQVLGATWPCQKKQKGQEL